MQPEEAGLPYAPLCSAALANLGTNLTALPLRKRSGWSECRSQTCFGFLVIFSVLGFFLVQKMRLHLFVLYWQSGLPGSSVTGGPDVIRVVQKLRMQRNLMRSGVGVLRNAPIGHSSVIAPLGSLGHDSPNFQSWKCGSYMSLPTNCLQSMCVCVDVMGCSYYVVLCCTGIWLVMILLSPRLQPWLNLLLEKGLDRQLSAAGLARLLAAAGRLGVLEAGVP